MYESKYFNVGKVVWTQSINNMVAEHKQFGKEVLIALMRFLEKDWGDLDEEDK